MVGITGAKVAAEEHVATSDQNADIVEEGRIAASKDKLKKKGFWRSCGRFLLRCIPKSPKSADGWTNHMAIAATVFIPAWFYLAHKWNPNYVPVRGPVWATPWQVAFYWFGFQMTFLSISIQKSADEIRFREIMISFLPLLSCAMTLSGLGILWVVNLYQLSLFPMYEMWAFISAATFNAVIGGGVRFALKGRIFGQLGAVNNS